MAEKPPAISGVELMKLLEKDGWVKGRHTRHGAAFNKTFPSGETRVTIVPNKTKPLPEGTLRAILGPRQTGIGRRGLLRLLEKGKRK
jgi:predicted RNA binding protein YcfA (HicA-like mRNA interferase family)